MNETSVNKEIVLDISDLLPNGEGVRDKRKTGTSSKCVAKRGCEGSKSWKKRKELNTLMRSK